MPDLLIWPPVPRRVLRAALAIGYSMAVIVGVDVVANDSTNPGAHMGRSFIAAVGYICALGGVVATVGVIGRRWRAEFIAIAGIGAVLALYSFVDWMLVLFVDTQMPLRGPAIVTFTVSLLVARGAYLYAFSRRTVAAKRVTRAGPRT